MGLGLGHEGWRDHRVPISPTSKGSQHKVGHPDNVLSQESFPEEERSHPVLVPCPSSQCLQKSRRWVLGSASTTEAPVGEEALAHMSGSDPEGCGEAGVFLEFLPSLNYFLQPVSV